MNLKEIIQQVKAEGEAYRKQTENCTFELYEVTDANTEAYKACLEVAENLKLSNNLLYIYGSQGTGKTHLLRAIKNYITKNMPNKTVKLVNADEFTAEVIWMLCNGGDEACIRENYKKYDLFLLDDIQYLSGKRSSMQEFFNIINTLIVNDKQVVVTADCSPKELIGFEQKIIARLEWGNVVKISQ